MTPTQARALGAYYQAARERHGHPLSAVAEQVGTTKSWMHRFEGGHYQAPGVDRLMALADALSLDAAVIDDLSGGYLRQAQPSARTYFRAATDLPSEAIDRIEQVIGEIQAEYGDRGERGERS